MIEKQELEAYRIAQESMTGLKLAVRMLLKDDVELSNAEIGRKLGIYAGHKGHDGHISRTVLAMLEAEGFVSQDDASKLWKQRQ